MKKWIPIIGLLCFTLPGHAQTFVQVQTTICSGGFTTMTCAYSSNTTAGNTGFLVIECSSTSSCTPSVTSDTQGKTWTNVASCQVSGLTEEMFIFEADGLSSGAESLTVTVGSQNVAGTVAEWSGLSASAFDKTACGTGDSATLNSGNTTTTSQANELVFSLMIAAGGSGAITATDGSTSRLSTTSPVFYFGSQNVTSTGTYAASGTVAFANWGALVATFKASGGGPPACTGQIALTGAGCK
jgi:hypothetical protein